MKIPFILILMIGLIFFVAIYFLAESEREEGFVIRIIDGDTVELNNSEKVRLLGINTPEKGEPLYAEAKKRLEQLVLNETVYMEKDKENEDKYGRLLRYVYLGDEMVNLRMIEEGYATVYVIKPNDAYKKVFEEAEEVARISRKGFWSLVSEDKCSPCIVLEEFNWNAEGDDCENANGEWFELENVCSFDCDLTGWSVKDAGTTTYNFPKFVLASKFSVKIFSGSGNNTQSELYWNRKGSCRAIWSNDGDTLFLRDSEGELVLKKSYESEG